MDRICDKLIAKFSANQIRDEKAKIDMAVLAQYREKYRPIRMHVSEKLKSNRFYSEVTILKYFTELYTYRRPEIIYGDEIGDADIFLIDRDDASRDGKRGRNSIILKIITKDVITLGVPNTTYNMTAILQLTKICPDDPKPVKKKRTNWFDQ